MVPPRRLGVEEFREIERIGSNLNQIARVLNSGRGEALGWQEFREIERLRELLGELMPEKRD